VSATYKHTQSGLSMIAVLVLPAAVLVFAGFDQDKPALLVLAALLALLAFVFSSLTIEVTREELIWFFGPGLWRYRLKRTEIACANAARNPWSWGWGIHLTPRGWLYNVAGLGAVEIARTDGRLFRLGSDEPEALARALQEP
jgi:hypothetical protein